MKKEETLLPTISKPANRALHEAGYRYLEQLTQVEPADLLKLHGVGPKAIRILTEELAKHDLLFKQKS